MIKLDILSDPICPWCYIGWQNLARAMESRPEHPFAIEWHPFQLNPEMPREGMNRRAYLEAKFGGTEGTLAAYAPVLEHAEAAGFTLHLDRIARTPNTLDAHRLIHWAGIEGRQTPMATALFRAYFVEGRDIGQATALADLAAGIGLDGAMIARLLQGEADRDALAARDRHARARGVQGVPCFILGERHVLSGAQAPETWQQIIDDIAALPPQTSGADERRT
jgi:predicted DsbA family dithiol-disulfide isomerase